ncbi:hypothetical protein LOTGIDRAFT_155113 [Lottia gigantea]|uniref:DNA-directed DNA polymerase n=1 Tax=Lottia gigantea TaxID=225164 RepID=V3Z4K9_LOTGI|nr:hypothetical protein LOTGIDRAFT_155113 [Lottia gigantea]ESO85623.1 hypothetical protein LOTGIDRAFT_155113 [Lottia gigantea]
MDEICNILKEYTETPSDNIIDLFKEYTANPKDKTEVHAKLQEPDYSKLMAFDANGLYASAMSDLDSEYPRAESARGILSLPLTNSFTDEDLQKKWKRQKEIKGKTLPSPKTNYLQNINFICSYQHQSSSLAAWGNSSNLPMNLKKVEDVDIAKYTKDNWEPLRHEWEPYAKRETLCLGACLIKYNQAMKEVVFQNISNILTALSLYFKGWYYLYHYDKEMVEEEWYESTRMVPKHTEKENVEKVYSPFYKIFYQTRVSANRKSFEKNKMDEICNILKEYTETPSDNIIDLFKEYTANPKDKTEVHAKLKELDYSKLMAFDANGLYASAMSDLDSEYPRAESGRPFRQEEN